MFKVYNNGKEQMFTSKEELILHLARLEHVSFGLYSEEKLRKYTPRLFDQVAMNLNDCYHPGMTGRAMQKNFWPMMDSILLPRTIIVYEDNRIIDIREWLPEFQACLIRLKKGDCIDHHRFICSGSKPRNTKSFRIVHGYRQSLMPLCDADAEDIMDALGHIPSKCMRRNKMDDNIHLKQTDRSWKSSTKARKSWQRNSQCGRPESIRKMAIRDFDQELELELQYLNEVYDYEPDRKVLLITPVSGDSYTVELPRRIRSEDDILEWIDDNIGLVVSWEEVA